MTLFNISINNIKKNFKNYWAYFLSSSFSVFSVYLFMAILNQNNIQDQLGEAKKFIILFNMGSVMVILFSAFFIWYSNSFFIKSRKKEFATYMLLGMSKKQVARLNFLENIVIMALSLATGIILGLVFTKFFIMLFFYMIKSTAAVPFACSIKALKLTITVFIIIFFIINLHGSVLVRKSELIDLFNASKKVEKGIKVSFLTYITGIAAVILMAFGYYLAMTKLAANFYLAPAVVALVVIGTVLFFVSTTSLLINSNKKNEKNLFKGTKLIYVSQLYYRYKGNLGALSIIGITTTIALCALIACIGMYPKAEENSRYMRPLSIEYYQNDRADKAFYDALVRHSEISVKYKENIEMLKIKANDPISNYNQNFYVISQSKFNKLNKEENIKRSADLKNPYDCYFVQVQNFVTNEKALGKKANVSLGGKNYSLNITGTDIKPFIAMDHFNETLVVKDNLYNKMKMNAKSNVMQIAGYIFKDDFKAASFISDLSKKMTTENYMLTFYDHYCSGLKLLGMLAFIGLFLGLLFITATGSIIYFKMSMEAREDKNKFLTLSKIGVSKNEIKKAVSKELLILFGVPMLIAIANAFPAAKALGKMISIDLMQSYVVIVIIYVLLYCCYYFATLNSYLKTVTNK